MKTNHTFKHFVWLYPLAALACFVIVFWPKVQEMVRQWSGADNNYTYLVVPMFFYLCWDMRDRFGFKAFSWNYWGIVPGNSCGRPDGHG